MATGPVALYTVVVVAPLGTGCWRNCLPGLPPSAGTAPGRRTTRCSSRLSVS
ncbi:hypothetical protein [Amycolatopsis sp. lyj-90]|uniref:hypothetical protein n=1 Tax=Amycolatopsis sp. lyj-90 TaxID=2789285 RepID=UPI00397DFCB5